MPTLALGSRRGRRGFSLIELLVVVALVAIAAATIGLALRDPAQVQLEREAERLIALLETARAEARASGLDVRWQASRPDAPKGQDFVFIGLPAKAELPQRWLGERVGVEFDHNARELVLGPEPMLPRQGLRLRLGAQQLRIATDGLKPFAIEP